MGDAFAGEQAKFDLSRSRLVQRSAQTLRARLQLAQRELQSSHEREHGKITTKNQNNTCIYIYIYRLNNKLKLLF